MFTSFAIPLAATLLAGAGLAKPIAPRTPTYPLFNLIVNSTDGSNQYLNASVNACHSGAGIEALCVLESNPTSQFYFNTTSDSITNPGQLYFNPSDFPEALELEYQSSDSNIGYGFFYPESDAVELWFDEDNNQMGVAVNSSTVQYDWWVCPQTTEGYEYETVSFVKDFAQPTDSSCVPVAVYRVF